MSKFYRTILVSGAVWLIFGAYWLYLESAERVLTDVSTWESTTWTGLGLLLMGFVFLLLGIYLYRVRTPPTKEDLQSSVARIGIWGGECIITDDTVYIRTDERSGLKHFHTQKFWLAGLTLIFFVGTLLGGLGMAVSGLVVQLLPFRLFLPSLYVFLGSAFVFMGIMGGYAVWHTISLKRHLGLAVGTRTLSYKDAIPRDAIDAVVFDRYMDLPALYVKHQQADGSAVRAVFFLRDADAEITTAESAFRSLGVPVRRIQDPIPGA